MQAQDPSLQGQASAIGILYNFTLIVMFYQMDGIFIFLQTMMKAFQIVPVDAFINPLFFSKSLPLWTTSVGLLNYFMAVALQLAAPSLLAILMAETFLGIANRLAPQVQVSFLGMPLKSLLGIFLLWAAWAFVLKEAAKQTLSWLNTIADVVFSFGPFVSP